MQRKQFHFAISLRTEPQETSRTRNLQNLQYPKHLKMKIIEPNINQTRFNHQSPGSLNFTVPVASSNPPLIFRVRNKKTIARKIPACNKEA